MFAGSGNFNVIPAPNQVSYTDAPGFQYNNKTKIIIYTTGKNDAMERNAQFLADYLFELTRIRPVIDKEKKDNSNAIILALGKLESNNAEAYKLIVNQNNITITGNTPAGVFYGIQTLRKATPILPINVSIPYPAVEINDEPRFVYRGVHLDVGRHFFPAEFIKKYIDILALHNINTFHWHLTEDQGWRIEIKKYPKLTKIGSLRTETVLGKNSDEYDGIPYSGYYTQNQIRDIVKYAQDRYITIIPEIDMPGHMLAALAAYPELGCTGGPYEVATKWGVFKDVLCPGKEATFTFLENVLTEVCNLFPSKYIHIGGDECPKTHWETCPYCQAKIKELGLKDDDKHKKEFYLQSYLTERIEKFLNKKGRSIIGWDEIMEGKLAPNATVMSWRGESGGIEAAKMNHDAIMTPGAYLYFDHYQSKDIDNEPMAIGGYLPVETVYNYEPISPQLDDNQKKYIIGLQANVWTEYIPTTSQVEYMLMPRIDALCEVQWTYPEHKNYEAFKQNLTHQAKLYDFLGYSYAKHVFACDSISENKK